MSNLAIGHSKPSFWVKKIALSLVVLLFVQTGMSKTLADFKGELDRVNKSIDVTRKKMREIKDVSFLPDLYFVLAELYVDKARYLYTMAREKNKKTPIDEIDFTESSLAKKQAIELYQRFIDNFPKHANLDKAYFFMAHEYREMGNHDEMVKIYAKITNEFTSSRYWEEVQIILGDHFLETKKDPKMAEELYLKVLARPTNPFMPNARYKLGWAYINQNKFDEALKAFENVLTIDANISRETLPEIYRKSDVKRDSLLAMVWPYSEVKNLTPEQKVPLNYFEKLAPDRATFIKVLQRLAKRLMLKERTDDALPVYFRLLELQTDLEERLSTVDSFYEAFKKSKKSWPIEDLLEVLTSTLERSRYSPILKAPEKKKIEINFEIYLRDVSTQIQARFKSTKNKAIGERVITAYRNYLQFFPRGKFSNAIRLNLAETFFALGRYAEAGNSYETLSNAPKAKKEFLDSSLQSYALAMKNEDKAVRIDTFQSREGFRTVGNRFLKSFPRDEASPMILFNMARTYYDERDFEKATEFYKRFLKNFPTHKEATTAGQLILDSYNQREDYEGMIKAGKELIADPKITNSEFKKDVKEIVQQAEYRKIQNQTGDPKSKDYAKKLLGFASKYQGSSLGDQALFEAFMSFKNRKDPQAYEPGEQLLLRHGDSKYAKEVVAQMGQMALNTADYRRAAKYFEAFAKKYPQDPSSAELLKSASDFREFLGDFKEAADIHRSRGDLKSTAKQYFQAQDWPRVTQSLSAIRSADLQTNYWNAIAFYRLGQFDSARNYLDKVTQAPAGTAEEKAMAAHSLYLRARFDLRQYENLQLGSGDEAQITKQKAEKLAQLSGVFNRVLSYGNGRWTIAGLYALGRANLEFSEFITQASIPAGLSADQQGQFKQIINQQASSYKAKAQQYFNACIENAQKYEVFTQFALGCRNPETMIVNEAQETQVRARAGDGFPVEAPAIRRQLFDSPRDINLLMRLATSYLSAKDFPTARLILNRVLELDPKNSRAQGWIGVAFLGMNDLVSAAAAFNECLKMNSREPLGLYGMLGLYRNFQFTTKVQQWAPRLKGIPLPTGPIHPWMASTGN